MIEINGSYGEGGGALLRTAAALSASTGKPIHVYNIRAKRPKGGLMPQHLHALKSVSQLTTASFKGLELRSTEITFKPGAPLGGFYSLDIGTAGSITLVLQCFMLPAVFAKSTVNITLKGGTDVRWSPSVDYLQNVTLPTLKNMGYTAEMDLIRRGHFPRGGGILKLKIDPIKKLRPINLENLEVEVIRGISHSVKLPEHVALRQAKSAEDFLRSKGYEIDIQVQHSNDTLGPGSGIVLWSEGRGRVGGSSMGGPGKRAEEVGKEAAKKLLHHISRKTALDRYMGDQIIPYMALAGDSHIKTAELTPHTLTNIHVAEKITGKTFSIQGDCGHPALILVN
jgi:RNA 3'-phosphate cyclase